MGFVHMGTNDKSVFPLGEAHCQLIAQAVSFLWCDLAGNKGLPDGVGDHIIGPAPPAGPGLVLPLGKKKLRVSGPAVALVAGNQPAAVRLFWILYIVDDVTDSLTERPAFAGVQGHNERGGDMELPPCLLRIKKIANHNAFVLRFYYTTKIIKNQRFTQV